MAYDFGSETLGIKNPFKVEGRIWLLTGLLLVIAGIFPLYQVSAELQKEAIYGYTYALLGFVLVSYGIRYIAGGLFQMFRYYVGRSVPNSLAKNFSRSDDNSSQASQRFGYENKTLYSMLMGRKNITFVEPNGWMARLIHTFIPKLIFLPPVLRRLIQELCRSLLQFMATIICFLIVYFVVATGLAGDIAKAITMPIFSLFVLCHLLFNWVITSKSICRGQKVRLQPLSSKPFGVLIAMSVLIPVLSGYVIDHLFGWSLNEVKHFVAQYPLFSAWGNLAVLGVVMIVVAVGVIINMRIRFRFVTPKTEVSEYRDNLQENVHPKEIFINIENIVMANRRYKEVPNRVYIDFDPKLSEQTNGKGEFFGELLVETQPEYHETEQNHYTLTSKLIASLLSHGMILASFAVLFVYGFKVADLIHFVSQHRLTGSNNMAAFLTQLNHCIFGLFLWVSTFYGGRMLRYAAHLFWGEMSFNSLLMLLKTEGTYTESKVSTGMALHDSTRSENAVVRSSITPWVITSRIQTTIFSTSGFNNLEAPRYIMAMQKNDDELNVIIDEIKSFLGSRETIASIHNQGDLNNTSTIHQINSQSRSLATQPETVPREDDDALLDGPVIE